MDHMLSPSGSDIAQEVSVGFQSGIVKPEDKAPLAAKFPAIRMPLEANVAPPAK